MARHDSTATYKSGTVTSIADDNLSFVSSGVTWSEDDTDTTVGGDVNRYIRFTNGPAFGNIRRITNIDASTNTVTVEAPFGVSAFRGLTNSTTESGFVEGIPAVGNSFVVSWDLFRLANGDETFDSTGTGISPGSSNTNNTAFPNDSSDLFEVISGETGSYRHIRVAPIETHGTQMWWITSGNQLFHYRNGIFEWQLGNAPSGQRQGQDGQVVFRGNSTWVFGDMNFGDTDDAEAIGYPENTCRIIDHSTSFSRSSNSANTQYGHQFYHGGEYHVTGTTTFVRGYANNATNDANTWYRFIDVDIYGNFGLRISGDNSIVYNGSASGYTIQDPTATTVNTETAGNIGFFNPVSPGFLSGTNIRNSQQVIYNFFDVAGSTTVPQLGIQDIGGVDGARIIRGNHTGGLINDLSMTLLDWNIGDIQRISSTSDVELYHVDGADTRDHLLHLDKTVNIDLVNENSQPFNNGTNTDGDLINEADIRVVSSNASDTLSDVTTITGDGNSRFSDVLTGYTFNITDTVENFDDTDAQAFAPFTFGIKSRRRSFVSTVNTLLGDIGPSNSQFALLPDINVVDTNDNIDGYTEVETSQKAYDYADLFKYNNLSLPTLTSQLFNISGDEISQIQPNHITLQTTAQPTPITFESNTITMTVTGDTFTGSLNNTHVGCLLDLGGKTITGNVNSVPDGVSNSINGIRTFTAAQYNADTNNELRSIGGTVTGIETLTVGNDDVYIVLGQETGNTFQINASILGTGRLLIAGPNGGFPGTGTTRGGVTLSGGAEFVEPPEVSTQLNIVVPANTAYRINYQEDSSTAAVINGVTGVTGTTVNLSSLSSATNTYLPTSDVIVSTTQYSRLYARQTFSSTTNETVTVNAPLGVEIPGLPNVTVANGPVIQTNASLTADGKIPVSVSNTDRGSRALPAVILTAAASERITTRYLAAMNTLITSNDDFTSLTSGQDVIIPTANGIDFVEDGVDLRRSSSEDTTQVIVNGRTVGIGGAVLTNADGSEDTEGGETAPSRDNNGNAEVIFARRTEGATISQIVQAEIGGLTTEQDSILRSIPGIVEDL